MPCDDRSWAACWIPIQLIACHVGQLIEFGLVRWATYIYIYMIDRNRNWDIQVVQHTVQFIETSIAYDELGNSAFGNILDAQ